MHRVALIVLWDASGALLLQHRTDDAPFYPGYWGLFGGAIEAGETPEEAVRREAWEELRIRLDEPVLVLEQDFSAGGVPCHMHLFAQRYDGAREALELCEGQGWGWFLEEQTQSLLMNDHDRLALRAVGTQIHRNRP